MTAATPESWRELWAVCTPVMRVRLAVLLGTMALMAGVVLASAAGAVSAVFAS